MNKILTTCRSNTRTEGAFVWSQQIILALLYGGLTSIAFLDGDYYYLSWIAFVPLLWAVENATVKRTYALGLIAGISCFMSATYWVADFISLSKGFGHTASFLLACVVWLYCAHLIAGVLLLFKWLKKHTRMHEFLLFPIVVATFTSAYPMLFSMRLGESQTNFLSALQAIELFGVHGLDSIIALFNIVLFRLLYRWIGFAPRVKKPSKWPWAVALSVIGMWFVYGVGSLFWWQRDIASWPTLTTGVVQPNEIPVLGKTAVYPGYGYAYPPEMEMTERLSSLGAELVVWPEAQAKRYLDNPRVKNAFQQLIERLSISLVFQDIQQDRSSINGEVQAQYNTAVMLDNNGQQIGRYRKLKRIPFGEYIPIISDSSFIRPWAEEFIGEFLNEISKGEHYQLFKHEEVNIVPLICYETTFPSFVARAIKETSVEADQSNGTLLVGLSNDGWFGSTHQPYQHIMASVLRAVENRLPLIHVANNGPSIVVDPSGRVIFTSDFRQAGGYIANVPISNTAHGSFYSRHPYLFDSVLYISLIFIIITALRNIALRKSETPSSA